ncbi:MAG: type VI secretion system membrane subunit TssM [Curvibacter sp.]|nr:type VI secretion system membrane subunit TssM [Curvibacter sp.]
MLRTLSAVIFNRVTLVLCGLVLLSLVIWFIGPLVYIQPYQPLESPRVRLALIALIFGLWLVRRLFAVWRRQQLNGRLLAQLSNYLGSQGAPGQPQPGREEVAELEGRFREALRLLSRTPMGDSRGGWFGRLTRRYVYQLPWYLIIGAPGSGKTTALINSGLNFPLDQRFGKGSIKGVGGTRNCDWWFTDEAVLLDTAGRYTTHESDALQDKAAWSGFLQLLRRFRGRQPVNGVILTLSVQDLLGSTRAQRAELAHHIGLRLGELCEELAIRFPVYVLVTKADLLSGFNEFFGGLSREERAQVWGFTFAYDAQAGASDALAAFGTEFDALCAQIYRLLPQRLLAEPDLSRRGAVYALPQQVAGLRDVVHEMLDGIFAGSRIKERPILRGMYLTSGTQEGMPFDRVMSALARRFSGPSATLAPVPGQAGKSFFIEALFKRVMFNEAGLTGRNARKERQLRWAQGAGLAALLVLLAAACLAWTLSYEHNQAYLAEVSGRLARLQGALQQARPADTDHPADLLPVLDQAENLAVSQRYSGDSAPMGWRYGLLQVPRTQAVAEAGYLRLLDEAWLPQLAQEVRRALLQAPLDNPEISYETLKVYLMLHDPDHFDADAVKAWLTADWTRGLNAQLQQDGVVERLSHHLDRLSEGRVVVSASPIDTQLVSEVRQRLAQMSPAQRAYSRLRQYLLNGRELPPDFSVVRASGPEAPQVFSRRSGKPLTQGISGLYTYDGYQGVFLRELPKVTALLASEERWVLGQTDNRVQHASEALSGQLTNEVRRLYLMDYARLWQEFLADVQPVRMTSLEQTAEQARLYASANSSVELFMRAVARETSLSRRPEAAGTSSWLGEKLNRLKEEQAQLSRVTGQKIDVGGLAGSATLEADLVDARFRDYQRLAGSPGSGPAPIVASLQVMGEAAAAIASIQQQVRAGTGVPASLPGTLDKLRAESRRVPAPLNAMYDSVAVATSSFVGRDVRSSLTDNLNASVGDFCRRAILGRYPFTRSAGRDVTADDFATLFSPGGRMDEFFRSNLQALVDISTKPWSFRQGVDGSPVGGSAALASFQRAAALRDVFFRQGGKSPGVRLEIKPLDMDASISQMLLDVDGEVLRYQHGPQIPKTVAWPGSRGSGQVRLQITVPGAENTGLVTEGPWALHRLFDRAQILPGNAPERFIAVFTVDGRRLRFEVTTSSVLNPFRLQAMEEFQCPSNL